MAAVIVPKNSAANAVPDDASIPPNSHPYIKVTVHTYCENKALLYIIIYIISTKKVIHLFENLT